MPKKEPSGFQRANKHQRQRGMAHVVNSLQEQARYEIRTVQRAIAVIHRVLRESDNNQNQKRLGALIGELTSLALLIETEVEQNINHSFDTSEIEEEPHSSIV